jgi:uncharacterized ferritin-like protein (DUF455 family)
VVATVVPATASSDAPPAGSLEASAFHYLTSEALADKLLAPDHQAPFAEVARAWRVDAPGRPPELDVVERGPRVRSLKSPKKRAELIHTFWHHELQAAELMCWAALRFVDTPEAFRRGLIAIAADEVRHMHLYRDYLHTLGFAIGDFPVRDWFWQRIPSGDSPAAFVATMGIGFEGGNLDHTRRFAVRFREIGDEPGAALQEKVGREEVAHVRFALKWFRNFTGGDDFDTWREHLPPPLSPAVMRGRALDLDSRGRAGMSDAFLDELAAWRWT